MKDLIDALGTWRSAGRRCAVARVVGVAGSGPRLPGAAMAVNDLGEVIGSVSGGCVEGAVVAEATELLEGTEPGRLVRFGYSDDDAFAVGLTCGGIIDIYLEQMDWWPVLDSLGAYWAGYRPVALATVVGGRGVGSKLLVDAAGSAQGTLGDPELDRIVVRDIAGELASARSTVRRYGTCGEANLEDVEVFIESFAPPPRLLIFGAVDFTGALARVGKVLGFHVTVVDARAVFCTAERFPMADEVVVDWPHRYIESAAMDLGPNDAVCVLTHDHKFDVPAIITALGTQVGYLGAMGSRRTHADRVARLREEGVDDAGLDRIMAPIGLDLGARTPEETAVSICAEIIAMRTGRTAPSLRDATGPIH